MNGLFFTHLSPRVSELPRAFDYDDTFIHSHLTSDIHVPFISNACKSNLLDTYRYESKLLYIINSVFYQLSVIQFDIILYHASDSVHFNLPLHNCGFSDISFLLIYTTY